MSDELRAVLQSLHIPALVLSQSRTVVAVNDGICRLTGKQSHESLTGHKIDDLGFELVTGECPVYRGWDPLLHACAADQDESPASSSNSHESASDTPHASWAGDFWENEDRRRPAVLDVMITRSKPASAPGPENRLDQLRARMSIRVLRLGDVLMYIAIFQRPGSRQHSGGTNHRDEGHSHDQASDTNAEGTDSGADVAEHFLAEGSTDRETQVHRIVSTAIPYFTALFDANGQVVHLSTSWSRVIGLSGKATLGNGWFDAIHPDDRQAMKDAWFKVVSNREDEWTWEARYRKDGGTYHWFLVRVQASRGESNKINYYYGSMMDVHSLLRTRQESENRRKSIMAVVAHTDVCLWGLKDDESLLLQEGALSWDPMAALNQQSRRRSSSNSRNIRPKSIASIDAVAETIREILDGKTSAKTLEHKDGDRWYRSTLIADLKGHLPHQSSGQATQAVLGLTIDITDVRARADLQAQNDSLKERERVARESSQLKSRFVANISHELRTPIAGIIGINDLLMESLTNKKQRYFCNNIRASAAQLLNVINDVLDLSKIEAGRLEIESVPFRICKLVENIHNMMAVQAERKGLEFICKNVDIPQQVVVIGDPNRLQQVFLNLLSNSIKFTSSGKVTLEASLVMSTEAAEDVVSKPSTRDDEQSKTAQPSATDNRLIEIEFVVEDTGVGMTQAVIEKSFEAFSQADSSTARQYGGTGLGLTITRQLVDMMKGSIHFTSTPSVGTRATVRITFKQSGPEAKVEEIDLAIPGSATVPAADLELTTEATANVDEFEEESAESVKNDSQNATALIPISPTPREKTLVLIVEDNAVNLKIATLMTEKLGAQVITAENGEEALKILETRTESGQPSPDIILMDCQMPIMDGYEATRRLRQDTARFSESLRKTPIIALTASAHTGDKERCLEAGMDDYMIKPVNKKNLQQALEHWIAAGQQGQGENERERSAGGQKDSDNS